MSATPNADYARRYRFTVELTGIGTNAVESFTDDPGEPSRMTPANRHGPELDHDQDDVQIDSSGSLES